MPYIDPALRESLDQGAAPVHAGDLNYLITKLIRDYTKGGGYEVMNEAIGALECAKLELYRRILSPYEDRKLRINGDVY